MCNYHKTIILAGYLLFATTQTLYKNIGWLPKQNNHNKTKNNINKTNNTTVKTTVDSHSLELWLNCENEIIPITDIVKSLL